MCCWCSASGSSKLNSPKGIRSCTDVGFLLIFIVFCSGLGTTTWYALSRGDPYRIFYGSDSFGNTCGRENNRLIIKIENEKNVEFEHSGQDMSKKKYMLPMNSTNPLNTIWNCVEQCPNETITSEAALSSYAIRTNNSLCVELNESKKSFCPILPIYRSISIINRCIPENIITLSHEAAKQVIDMDFIRGYLSEVIISASFILKMCLISFVFSITSIFVLRFFAPVLIYFIYILIVVVFASISGALWYSVYLFSIDNGKNGTFTIKQQDNTKTQMASLLKLGESRIDSWLRMENTSELTVIGLAVGASAITVFVAFIVWCLFPRGQKMIKLFKQASKALAAMPILLLQPIVTSIAVIIIAMYTLSTLFLLYTAGESVTQSVTSNGLSMTTINTEVTETIRIMFIYQLVGFIWLTEFVLALQRLFIAGSISLWYFDSRRGSGRSSICSSLKNTFRYHMGSAALGSFIITLIRIPRYILMYIYAKMKAVENPIARKLLFCFILILSCIERCLNYISYNAYTIIAYSGCNFCPAAKTAVNTLLDNAIDVAALNTVGVAVLYLTKFMVATITATISAYQITMYELNHPWLPVVIIFICSYLIANCFLSVYAMTLDTLLLCAAEDADLARENPDNEDSQEFQELVTLSRNSSKSHKSRKGALNHENQPLNNF